MDGLRLGEFREDLEQSFDKELIAVRPFSIEVTAVVEEVMETFHGDLLVRSVVPKAKRT